ncbi:gliding motility-associated C-terminal domain-containing protein [Aurantibacter sp.]|uniref:T9SS type B sorting domain-containing protein n=1 Tax=Aurantibacter sp. TaxID=2807103 RepID=UPI00326478AD
MKKTYSSNLVQFFICIVAIFGCTLKMHSQANSIRTGVTFNWSNTQSSVSDPANIQSINIEGVDYTTFVVPSSYEMTRLGPGGDVENNIWLDGSQIVTGSDDPNWIPRALSAYQSLDLNHYFQSQNNGADFCNDYTAITTTNAQIQTIRYNPGIPSNPDGVLAVTERGGNNCMYIELYGIPAGGGAEQLLGRTFIRNEGNLTGVIPQAQPTANSDYWSSGRNNENNQVIGIALYELSELAPVGSTINSIRYMGATNDHGDGKFFLMQTYAEDDSLRIKLDREGNGDIAANDMVPPGSTYTLSSTTSNGTLMFNADGTFNYLPNPGFTGNDTFEYEVCLPAPNTAVCDTGTAIIIIKLEAIFDNVNVSQNSSNNIIYVLDNDNFGSSGPRVDGAITNFTSPTNGSVTVNNNGTPADTYDDFFEYTPNANYIGTDFFDYEITDAVGSVDIASVYITIAYDTDADLINDRTDLDDDNDGILDSVEGQECIDDDYFAWEFNSPVGTRTNDYVQNPAITNWLVSNTTNVVTGAGLTGNSPAAELQLTGLDAITYAGAIAANEYVEVSFTTASGLINPMIERIGMNWYRNSNGTTIGNSYDVAMEISKDNFATSILLYSDIRIHYPTNGVSEFFDLTPAGSSFNLEENTTYTIRLYTYNQQDDGNVDYSVFDDFTVRVSACEEQNSDSDDIPDHLDADSDNDFCYDVSEAGHADADGDGFLGDSPVVVDADGLIIGQGGFTGTTTEVTTPHQMVTTISSPTDQTVNQGDNVSFTATADGTAITYQWEESTDGGVNWNQLTDSGIYSGVTTTTLTISNIPFSLHSNVYQLVITDPNNPCISEFFTDAALITVNQQEDELEVFNVVTPNNDGVHDVLTIRNIESYPTNDIQIYNRWGILVYETLGYNNLNNSFDGYSRGRTTVNQNERLPVGTYYYILNYTDNNAMMKELAGYLYLN